ncbi:MAG: hypothetical protein M5R36_22505 [Deltaproteobacteria bacterium]|nr:hypothetical protein [Deltaproteobacteria bacterium]
MPAPVATQIPKLNTAVDFGSLAISLTERDTLILSRVNGISSLADLSKGLRISIAELTEIIARLAAHDLIRFDDAAFVDQLLARKRPAKKAAPPAERAAKASVPQEADEPVVDARTSRVLRQGDWTVDTVARVVAQFYAEHATGVLSIRYDPNHSKNLFFENGRLIQVTSRPFDPGQCLGRVLQRIGKLRQQDVVESLVRRKQTDNLQGRILVEMNVISPKELEDVLARQAELKLRDIFTLWQEGVWDFRAVESFGPELARVDLDLPRLLYSLIWKYYDFDTREDETGRGMRAKVIGADHRAVFAIEDISDNPHVSKAWHEVMDKDTPFQRLEVIARMKSDTLDRFVRTLSLLGLAVILDRPRAGDASGRIKLLRDRLTQALQSNHFDILGIHWNATTRDIQRAYEKAGEEREKALRGAETSEERDLIERFFERQEKAFDELQHRKRRYEYRVKTFGESFVLTHIELHRQKAESLLFTKEDYLKAAVEFENAIEIDPDNADFYAEYGLARFLASYPSKSDGVRQARRSLSRSLNMAPETEMPHLCAGIVALKIKDPKAAAICFQRVQAINAANALAGYYLHEIETGKPSEDDLDRATKTFLTERDRRLRRGA